MRFEHHYSIRLAQAVIDRLLAENPGSAVKTTDLVKLSFPHLEEAHLTSFFTPPDQHSGKDKEAIRHSNDAIKDIMEADILVIGAPMYNFSIQSSTARAITLRSYRPGRHHLQLFRKRG